MDFATQLGGGIPADYSKPRYMYKDASHVLLGV